ncbi:hypothetical protein D3C87_77020 [compost metagenome]
MIKALKFIFSFILFFALAAGAGWLLVQLEFMVKAYTDFGKTLHYIGLALFSVFAGFWGAVNTTNR